MVYWTRPKSWWISLVLTDTLSPCHLDVFRAQVLLMGDGWWETGPDTCLLPCGSVTLGSLVVCLYRCAVWGTSLWQGLVSFGVCTPVVWIILLKYNKLLVTFEVGGTFTLNHSKKVTAVVASTGLEIKVWVQSCWLCLSDRCVSRLDYNHDNRVNRSFWYHVITSVSFRFLWIL